MWVLICILRLLVLRTAVGLYALVALLFDVASSLVFYVLILFLCGVCMVWLFVVGFAGFLFSWVGCLFLI